jgi:ribosomal-protein-alanine N-acetyltransferase
MGIMIQAPGFTIREFKLEEEPAFIDLFTDSRITPYIPKRTVDEVKQLFKDVLSEYGDGTGLSRWAVIGLDNKELIGFAMLRHDTEPGKAELGYALHYSYWNKGLATEISKTLVAYGFQEKHLDEIFAVTDHENVPSQRVLLKAGLQRNGIISRKEMELAFFNITAEEYKEFISI